ncbi:hypothetical protein ACOMHN_002537 [Nucella lapillus]
MKVSESVVWPCDVPSESVVWPFDVPSESVVWLCDVPSESVVWPCDVPSESVVWPCDVPSESVVWPCDVPSESVVWLCDVPSESVVWPCDVPSESVVWPCDVPSESVVWPCDVPSPKAGLKAGSEIRSLSCVGSTQHQTPPTPITGTPPARVCLMWAWVLGVRWAGGGGAVCGHWREGGGTFVLTPLIDGTFRDDWGEAVMALTIDLVSLAVGGSPEDNRRNSFLPSCSLRTTVATVSSRRLTGSEADKLGRPPGGLPKHGLLPAGLSSLWDGQHHFPAPGQERSPTGTATMQ